MGFVVVTMFWVVVVLGEFRCCNHVLGGRVLGWFCCCNHVLGDRGARWVSLLQCSFGWSWCKVGFVAAV